MSLDAFALDTITSGVLSGAYMLWYLFIELKLGIFTIALPALVWFVRRFS